MNEFTLMRNCKQKNIAKDHAGILKAQSINYKGQLISKYHYLVSLFGPKNNNDFFQEFQKLESFYQKLLKFFDIIF